MARVSGYIVMEDSSLEAFTAKVNMCIAKGYQPLGGMTHISIASGITYQQALVALVGDNALVDTAELVKRLGELRDAVKLVAESIRLRGAGAGTGIR